MKRRSRIPLQLKVAVALFLIVMMPLGVAAWFYTDTGKAAANYGATEAADRIGVLERSFEAYHGMVNTTKQLHVEVANRLANRPDLLALDPEGPLVNVVDLFGFDRERTLHTVIDEPEQAGLSGITILHADGSVFVAAERPLAGPEWRAKVVEIPLGTNGATLQLTFEVSATVQKDLEALKQALDASRALMQAKSALPWSYTAAFLVLIGIAGLGAAAFGIIASTLLTGRIAALVSTARRVSEGRHDARVELRGRDEMAELGSAFNSMLDNLDQARLQVEYLQRMGVWQDVARRLAHEIKNPLTPIQLAVQQCVSAYKGDDPRFKKLLVDTGEIVEEEIAALRRLVDTFRTLGALPKVEPSPLVLAELIEELKLDPTMAASLTVVPPKKPVTVRADKLLLKRVLANLVENGIHAGEEAGNTGKVVVGWTSDGDTVRITIDDHGKGVTEADREKIFEPYVTTKTTGTGLGLAIARKIAIEHGGELAIAPGRAPTGGARFVVSLPLRGAEASLA